MKLVSVSEMVALENEANKIGLTNDQMMVNAGTALAQVVHKNYERLDQQRILGLIGSGNNGGDTLIALSILISKGWTAAAYLVGKRHATDPLVAKLTTLDCEVVRMESDESFSTLRKLISSDCVILDGILGTGIKLPLRKGMESLLSVFSEFDCLPKIVAVDCPSGVDCDSGDVDPNTLHADLTVCMAAVKNGLLKFPALAYTGEIRCVEIGLPDNLKGLSDLHTNMVDHEMVAKLLPARPLDSHKGTFGTCMIVGGSTNYPGAVILAARAAYKIGVGLVQAAIPGSIYDAIVGQVPECTWVVLPHAMGVINSNASELVMKNLGRVDAMLIGPGMGREKETLEFLKNFLKFKENSSVKLSLGFSQQVKPEHPAEKFEQPALVFDADALKLLAQIDKWWELPAKKAILTPHPGEMAVLTGLAIDEIQENREEIAKEYSKKWSHVVVLKGAVTIIASPEGETFFIPFATPALATAGTGDVLAGMITGLVGQGLSALDAAVAGAWLHAAAGKAAEAHAGQNISIAAGDVIDQIAVVLK